MARTMFGDAPSKPDYENVPSAVFSQPPIGTCGLSEETAAKKYGSVDVYLAKFKPMKHTMPTGRGDEEKFGLQGTRPGGPSLGSRQGWGETESLGRSCNAPRGAPQRNSQRRSHV